MSSHSSSSLWAGKASQMRRAAGTSDASIDESGTPASRCHVVVVAVASSGLNTGHIGDV